MKQPNLLEAASVSFDFLGAPSAWLGHLPFAAWITQEVRPKIFVELGTHYGHSYFAFCQSVVEATLATKCYAVDTWQGDEHAGQYNDDVFTKVNMYHQRHYAHFSRLLRMNFDDAVNYFSDQSINLLHIDGLHTYEAVRHDFETWLPKLASGAIVLFHDTNVRERGFGVWKFWEELQERYPNNLEFLHSHGLGVLQLNDPPAERQLAWLRPASPEKKHMISYFAALGGRQQDLFELNQIKLRSVNVSEEVIQLRKEVAERDAKLVQLNQVIVERDKRIESINQVVEGHVKKLQDLYLSNSWRITKPLRALSTAVTKSKRFVSKITTAKLRKVVGLVKPHIISIYHNPSLVREKFHIMWGEWRAGGVEEIIRRLHQSYIIRNSNESYPPDAEVERQMRDLVALAKQIHAPTSLKPRELAIIVPVYRGLTETRRCIESVLKSTNKSSYRLIIINDASPEPEVDEFLNSLGGSSDQIVVLRNPENLGFVETANRGMNLAGKADVVLLNSDTEVANDWLDRMVVQAYSEERIGTVTPFSNNATICSYPDLAGWPSLPPGETVERLDMAFACANAGHSIELPTAVGFCMYIKRACLEEIGLFDTETFGKGYGEENDFCLRAAQKGWRHILAVDVFVFHEGEVSFSESAASKKANAMNIIRKLYPDYERSVTTHIANNAAYIYRLSATAARYRLGNRPVVLFITHSYGGGTEKHVQELAQKLNNENCRVLYLRSIPSINGFDVTFDSSDKCDRLNLRLTSQNIQLLADVLRLFGVSTAHIHHTHGFRFEIESLLTLMRVPYDITIHDFYTICPRINFYMPGKGYCGTPTVEDCNNCLAKEPRVGNGTEIVWWRAKSGSLLNGARNVYCPSQDTANRILNFFPAACVSVVPHEQVGVPPTRYAANVRKARRFALLGVLAEHKGLSYVESVLIEAERKKLAIEFVLIGSAQRSLNSKLFSQTGAYKDEDLQALIEQFDPDAILFPAQCPETYSYTLSAAIRSGRPLVVSDLGALPERVRELDRGHVFSHSLPPAKLADYLASLPLRRETEIAPVA